jgi:hypothetical protein
MSASISFYCFSKAFISYFITRHPWMGCEYEHLNKLQKKDFLPPTGRKLAINFQNKAKSVGTVIERG